MTANDVVLNQLLEIMRRLRDPENGCPWDIKQNFQSIAPYTVEEAYEVADAIERNDLHDLQDELGDLLFQVVFHSQMASELSAFNFNDVVRSIVDKMIRRHPHVFGSVVFETEQDLKAAWESAKSRERTVKQNRLRQSSNASQGSMFDPESITDSVNKTAATSALDDIAVNLPALARADKMQKRAARVGFDWPAIHPVWEKLNEEINEVRAAIETGNSTAVEDEFGDLLFTVVNLARHCSIDSESALRRASGKFDRRFRKVETLAASKGYCLNELELDQLDRLWEEAKKLDTVITAG